MIVRMNELVVAALVARELECAVGDHLVRVHVRRRSRAALDHVDEEVLVVSAAANLARGTRDEVGDLLRQQPELRIRERRCFLDRRERLDERRELAQRHAGDREVLERAQRLHAVERLVGDLALAEQVVLQANVRAAESERAPSTHHRRVHGGEPLRDRAGGAADERGVERGRSRIISATCSREMHEHGGVGERASARAVRANRRGEVLRRWPRPAPSVARRIGRPLICFSMATAPLTTIARSCRSEPSVNSTASHSYSPGLTRCESWCSAVSVSPSRKESVRSCSRMVVDMGSEN